MFNLYYNQCSMNGNDSGLFTEPFVFLEDTTLYTILIAEDSFDNFLLLKEILKGKYTVIHADNGIDTIQLYNCFEPDLILMDIWIPILDGHETIKRIREISDKTPIVAVSACSSDYEIQKAFDNGCNEYVIKPICINKIKTIVNRYLP